MRKSAKSKSVSVETKLRVKRECIDEARDIRLKNTSAHFTLDRYQIYQIARNPTNTFSPKLQPVVSSRVPSHL